MINTSLNLALTGILQHKSPIIAPAIVDCGFGSLVYNGFAPSTSIVPLPVVVASPNTGSLLYTGFTPTTQIIPPFALTFETSLESSTGDTPWRVTYTVYDSSFVLRQTIVHDVNRGNTPFLSYIIVSQTYPTYTPLYVDVRVERRTELVGPPPRNNTPNFSGQVLWRRSDVTFATHSWTITQQNQNSLIVNQIRSVNGLTTGTKIAAWIYEG